MSLSSELINNKIKICEVWHTHNSGYSVGHRLFKFVALSKFAKTVGVQGFGFYSIVIFLTTEKRTKIRFFANRRTRLPSGAWKIFVA